MVLDATERAGALADAGGRVLFRRVHRGVEVDGRNEARGIRQDGHLLGLKVAVRRSPYRSLKRRAAAVTKAMATTPKEETGALDPRESEQPALYATDERGICRSGGAYAEPSYPRECSGRALSLVKREIVAPA